MIVNDKEILDKMNKDENYRSDVLINFNFEMQLAQRICYTHENKFSPQEYKLAVVSLEQENARLKKEIKEYEELIDKYHYEHDNEFKYWLSIREEHSKLKDRIEKAIELIEEIQNFPHTNINQHKDMKELKEILKGEEEKEVE